MCQRCLRAGRQCHGWAGTTSSLVVHSENAYASGHTKRPRGPRTVPSPGRKGSLAVSRSLPQSLECLAIGYYVHYHLQPPHLPARGVSDCFLPVWQRKADSTMLDLAIRSLALAVFSRTKRCPAAAVDAGRAYQELLKAMRISVSPAGNIDFDTCLVTISFMSRYENAVHEFELAGRCSRTPWISTVPSCPHDDGALAMLRLWRTSGHPVSGAIRHTRRSTIRSALLRALAVPLWLQDGSVFGESGDDLAYDSVLVRIAGLRQRLCRFSWNQNSDDGPLHSDLQRLRNEVRYIDTAPAEWCTTFPPTRRPQRYDYDPPEDAARSPVGSYGRRLPTYDSPAVACQWANYYATTMLIHSTLLRLLNICPSLPASEEQKHECLRRIDFAANDLASSIPYCLGRTKADSAGRCEKLARLETKQNIQPYVASAVVWPLTVAARLADVDERQKTWFTSALAGVGRLLGDRVLEGEE